MGEMTFTRWVFLPVELQQGVASWVGEIHRASLVSLSLVSHSCRAAASPALFARVCLDVTGPEVLRHAVDHMIQDVSRNKCASLVRQLRIKGSIMGKATAPSYPESYEEMRPYKALRLQSHPGAVPETEVGWSPVVDLLTAFPRLTCLVYDCLERFPPCLLEVLNTTHQQCRLDLRYFNFGNPSQSQRQHYPYEIELLRSPCIEKVRLLYREGDEPDLRVTRLAPNLKKLCVQSYRIRGRRFFPNATATWFSTLIAAHCSPGELALASGRLTTLTLGMPTPHRQMYNPEVFSRWMGSIRLDLLECLCLDGSMFAVALSWMSNDLPPLPNLKSLRVALNGQGDLEVHWEHAQLFLRKLHPLQALSMAGALSARVLQAALDRHGPSLITLELRPNTLLKLPFYRYLTESHLEDIQLQCPQLQNLEVPIRRDKGGPEEVNCYRILGRIKCLRKLSLTLKSHINDPNDEISGGDFDRAPFGGLLLEEGDWKNGHVRDILMNWAIDESLVKSIWDIIISEQGNGRLQFLDLNASGPYFGVHDSLSMVVRYLAKSLRLERRSGFGDSSQSIAILELRRNVRESHLESHMEAQRGPYERDEKLRAADTALAQVFQAVWPPKDESWDLSRIVLPPGFQGKDWRSAWASFPLRGSSYFHGG